MLGVIVEPAGERRSNQVSYHFDILVLIRILRISLLTDALSSQKQTIGGTELLDGDQVDQYGRGEAVVGRDTEPVGGGESEDGRVGGEEGDDGRDETTDHHADRVEDQAGDPLLVTQPTHQHLAHRVQDPDDGEDLG